MGTIGQIKIIANSATSQMPYDELANALDLRARFRKDLNLPQIYTIRKAKIQNVKKFEIRKNVHF